MGPQGTPASFSVAIHAALVREGVTVAMRALSAWRFRERSSLSA